MIDIKDKRSFEKLSGRVYDDWFSEIRKRALSKLESSNVIEHNDKPTIIGADRLVNNGYNQFSGSQSTEVKKARRFPNLTRIWDPVEDRDPRSDPILPVTRTLDRNHGAPPSQKSSESGSLSRSRVANDSIRNTDERTNAIKIQKSQQLNEQKSNKSRSPRVYERNSSPQKRKRSEDDYIELPKPDLQLFATTRTGNAAEASSRDSLQIHEEIKRISQAQFPGLADVPTDSGYSPKKMRKASIDRKKEGYEDRNSPYSLRLNDIKENGRYKKQRRKEHDKTLRRKASIGKRQHKMDSIAASVKRIPRKNTISHDQHEDPSSSPDTHFKVNEYQKKDEKSKAESQAKAIVGYSETPRTAHERAEIMTPRRSHRKRETPREFSP